MLKTVAIDGPVASGKTVVGQKLSKILDYRFLDTGTMYRAVSYIAIQDGLDYRDEDALTYLAANIGIKLELSSDGKNLLWVRGKEISGGLRSREVELILPTVSNKGMVLACINELCLLFFNAHCIKIKNELNKADAHTIIIIVFKTPLKTNDT